MLNKALSNCNYPVDAVDVAKHVVSRSEHDVTLETFHCSVGLKKYPPN